MATRCLTSSWSGSGGTGVEKLPVGRGEDLGLGNGDLLLLLLSANPTLLGKSSPSSDVNGPFLWGSGVVGVGIKLLLRDRRRRKESPRFTIPANKKKSNIKAPLKTNYYTVLRPSVPIVSLYRSQL